MLAAILCTRQAPTPPTAPTFGLGSGDDAFHPHKHRGWDRAAWLKKQKREEALEETVREVYARLTGGDPAPAVVVREVAQEAYQEAPKPSTFDYSGIAAWIQFQEGLIADLLARRREEDDEEAILLLMH